MQHFDDYAARLAALQRTDLEDRFQHHASVLLPLCHDHHGEPSILFTLRSDSLRAHSGEVSFPGGKRDTDDLHAEACALRECMEEVGIVPERMLGRWHDVTNKDGTAAVTPCVAYLGTVDANALTPNPDEVGQKRGSALYGGRALKSGRQRARLRRIFLFSDFYRFQRSFLCRWPGLLTLLCAPIGLHIVRR
jgi:8-oxo-dGTP pyrophosphatase MutT (NUDIX family)